MKIKDGFLLREVAGSHIVVPVGGAQMDFNGVVTLNPVGAFLWGLLEKDTDGQTLTQAVLNEYEVDEATARADIDRFVEKLRAKGLIED